MIIDALPSKISHRRIQPGCHVLFPSNCATMPCAVPSTHQGPCDSLRLLQVIGLILLLIVSVDQISRLGRGCNKRRSRGRDFGKHLALLAVLRKQGRVCGLGASQAIALAAEFLPEFICDARQRLLRPGRSESSLKEDQD